MKLLVTGATGFIGKHLVPRLLREGFDVRCLARTSSRRPAIFENDVEWITGDLSDTAALQAACRNIDLVIHLAGAVKAGRGEDFFKINTKGSENLLNAVDNGTRFIFISSQAAVGPGKNLTPLTEKAIPNPVSAYGRSKLLAEQLFVRSRRSIDYTIIRPAIVYGPEDRESLTIFRIAGYHLNPHIGFQKSYVNIVHIADLVELIVLCIHNNQANREIFHVNDGRDGGYTYNELIQTAAGYLDSWTVPLYIPKIILKTAAFLSSLIAGMRGRASMLNSDKYKELTARGWLLSSQKAREILGYRPQYDIDSGFKMTINWYREKGWL